MTVGAAARRASVADLARLVSPQLTAGGRVPACGPQPAAVLDLAAAHGVVGLLPDDGPAREAVVAARRGTMASLARALSDLALLRDCLATAEVPWVLVKGAVLAHELYPRPDVRPFADADVLVPPDMLGLVLEQLQSAGGTCLVRNWTLMSELGLAELPVRMPAGTLVDLHWSLVNRASVRAAVRLPTRELLDGARVTRALAGARTLDDVSGFVHVAWHCTYNGAVRLLWLCDVELAAARVLARAVEVRRRAEEAGVGLAVAVAVDRAAHVFPGGAAAQLASALPRDWWRSVTGAAGAVVASRPAGRRSGRALARATRATPVGSLLALRPPLHRRGPAGLSLSADVGGDEGRARYLVWAQEHGR